MKFGEKLKELREKANLTQRELGKQLGISARLVSYYEANKNIPNDPTMLNKIAAIFDVSLDYLLGGSDTQESKIHQLIKKLTGATQHHLLKWDRFIRDNDDNYYSWKDSFTLNCSSNTLYEKDDEMVDDDSFYVNYKDGAYILVRTFNHNAKTYKTALFIHYNNSFVFYASDTDISIIEDLYLAVRNQVLGVDSFVDEFLNDDLSKQKKNLNPCLHDDDIPF